MKINKLEVNEEKLRDLYLRGLAIGEIQGPPTGKASVDKPWLKFYTEEAILADLPEKTAYEYLKENNKDNKNAALNFFGLKTSYQDLLNQIDKTAESLTAMGVKENDTVVVNSVTFPQAVYLLYALNKIGAVADLTDVRTDKNGMIHYMNEGNSKLLFTYDATYPLIKDCISKTEVEKVILLSPTDTVPFVFSYLSDKKEQKTMTKEEKSKKKQSKKQVKEAIKTDEKIMSWADFQKVSKNKVDVKQSKYEHNKPAAIVHTSGTTGVPKSVVLTNDNFNAMALQYSVSDFKHAKGETILNIIPMFTAYGAVNSLHMPLCLGMTDIIYPKVVGEDFPEIIRKFKPNHVIAIPMHWEILMNDPEMKDVDLSFLKTAACGGDKLNIELEKKINQFLKSHKSPNKIVTGYGMTEVSACAATNTNKTSKLGSVGIPLVKNNVKIVKPETEEEVYTGETGEICISTPTLMKEYLNNEEETKKAIKTHADGIKWIHSGDLGHFSTDGELEIDGRLKRLIIRRGFKISAVSIEDAIMENKEINKCVVVKAKDNVDGEVPIAFIKAESDSNIDKCLLQAEYSCMESLPDYFMPAKYVAVDEFPYTKNNKVDIKALEEQANEINEKKSEKQIKTFTKKQ